ncbi:Rubisco Assembly chaperone [Gracilaria domingensis]|nr:Rubisco Assembly chaperone [Gracilaria domingensis]
MVTPKHIRRSNEIKRLERQLEELRALREKLGNEKVVAVSDTKPERLANEAKGAPPTSKPMSASETSGTDLKIGKHDEGSRFLSITNIESEELPPRILTIAGIVPGLTTSQFQNTPPVLTNKRPDKGNVVITKLPEDYHSEIMAISGSDVLNRCGDPVIILADPNDVSSTSLPITEGDLVALVVDRDMTGRHFENNKFYAWDVQGQIRVGWTEEEPHPSYAKCVGEVVFGVLEIKSDLRKKKSCWEEENEVYT